MASTPRNSKGSIRAKANLPAKAGKRKLPPARNGKYLTSAEQRAYAKWLSRLAPGLKPSGPPPERFMPN